MKENMTALLNAVTNGATMSLLTEENLSTIFEKLTPREKEGLTIRYGLESGGQAKSIAETAKIMNVTEDYIQLLTGIALGEIRQMYKKKNREEALASKELSENSDIAMLNIGVYEYRKLQKEGVCTISQFLNLSIGKVEKIFSNSHDIAAIATLRDDLGYPLR